MPNVTVSIVTASEGGAIAAARAGSFALPSDATLPWVLPRHAEHTGLAQRLVDMPTRLTDYGWGISTGPLVWNRHKKQLRSKAVKNAIPIIWAEAVTPAGGFDLRYQKRSDKSWLVPRVTDDALLVTQRVGLLQRTTAKEQDRRLIATCLPQDLLDRYGAVTVENHVNMIRHLDEDTAPTVSLETIVMLLNSPVVDQAFRCVSGSVAVSAFELESGLPLPGPKAMASIEKAMKHGVSLAVVHNLIEKAYGGKGG